MTDSLKSWLVILLTAGFSIIYAVSMFGWLRPVTDVTVLTRMEPIIFVIIGFLFGWLPAHQNEQNLREEIERQRRKADAAIYAKETIEKEREIMEEKIKNARTALLPLDDGSGPFARSLPSSKDGDPGSNKTMRSYVHTAIMILDI